MAQRCSISKYLGLAAVPGYRWIINARGSANIIQLSTSGSHMIKTSESRDGNTAQQQALSDNIFNGKNAAWGLVYYLAPSDEAYLDTREHVPDQFTKEWLPTLFWPSRKIWNVPFDDVSRERID